MRLQSNRKGLRQRHEVSAGAARCNDEWRSIGRRGCPRMRRDPKKNATRKAGVFLLTRPFRRAYSLIDISPCVNACLKRGAQSRGVHQRPRDVHVFVDVAVDVDADVVEVRHELPRNVRQGVSAQPILG